MTTVRLIVEDPGTRVTLKTMLEAAGCRVVEAEAEVVIADTVAVALGQEAPTLLLTTAGDAAGAVAAMKQGVYGYILLPFVPGEAALMVSRASGSAEEAVEMPSESMEVATLSEVERLHIETVLRLSKHNQAKAARALGIGRNTLWRKLKQYGIERSS